MTRSSTVRSSRSILRVDHRSTPSRTFGGSTAPLYYYAFDVLILAGQNVMAQPLHERRQLLEERVLPKLREPVRAAPVLNAELADIVRSVRAQGLEGVVAKRRDSVYEPGLRSGAWQKMRVNRGQEFVIGGYTVASSTFDALVFGYYDGPNLIYVARTRNGFTPASRVQLFKRFRGLETAECPFVNLPETKAGRWGQGLTAAKMADCKWLNPILVGQFEFVEWTPDITCGTRASSGCGTIKLRVMSGGRGD